MEKHLATKPSGMKNSKTPSGRQLPEKAYHKESESKSK